MFQDKKEAEEYDKMLELAENITSLLDQHISGLDPSHSEAVGLFLAKHRELLAKACKGKPELLLEEPLDDQPQAPPQMSAKVANLTPKA